jgi:hypothetical protein
VRFFPTARPKKPTTTNCSPRRSFSEGGLPEHERLFNYNKRF